MNGANAKPHIFIVEGKLDKTNNTVEYCSYVLREISNSDGLVQSFSKEVMDIPNYDFILSNIDPYRRSATFTVRYNKNEDVFTKTIAVGEKPTYIGLDGRTMVAVGGCMFEYQSTEEATYQNALAVISDVIGVELTSKEEIGDRATKSENERNNAEPHIFILAGDYDKAANTICYRNFGLKKINDYFGPVQKFSKETIDIPNYEFILSNIDPYRRAAILTIMYNRTEDIFTRTIAVGDKPIYVDIGNGLMAVVGACMFEYQNTEAESRQKAIETLSNEIGVDLSRYF